MTNKIKILCKNRWVRTAGVLFLTGVLCLIACSGCNKTEESEPVLESIKETKEIEITETEMKEYRDRIGTDMDIKKSYLILFEDEESCRAFIESNGADDDPAQAGIGIIPMMENGYYNIVGKKALEDAFDLLKDGEFSKEPVVYSNMYCYLKRIGIDSPINNDETLKELIRNERYQMTKKAGE